MAKFANEGGRAGKTFGVALNGEVAPLYRRLQNAGGY